MVCCKIMSKRLLFVINPYSGRAEIRLRGVMIIDQFIKAGYEVEVYTTQKTGAAIDYVAQNGSRFDRIVCCGGDGTVNEVLCGIMQLEKRPELAIIPAGTINDYAYTLHIPFSMTEAAEVACSDRLYTIDVGRFDQRYFTYVAAFGIFTDVTYETPQDTKNLFGKVAYALEGAKRLGSIRTRKVRVEHDNGVVEGDYLLGLFSNTRSVAGIRQAFSDAKLDDGLMEITLIKNPSTPLDAQAILNILMGIEPVSRTKSDFIQFITTKHARVISHEPISWTVDGESGGSYTDVEICNCPHAIQVVVGADALPDSQKCDLSNADIVE